MRVEGTLKQSLTSHSVGVGWLIHVSLVSKDAVKRGVRKSVIAKKKKRKKKEQQAGATASQFSPFPSHSKAPWTHARRPKTHPRLSTIRIYSIFFFLCVCCCCCCCLLAHSLASVSAFVCAYG